MDWWTVASNTTTTSQDPFQPLTSSCYCRYTATRPTRPTWSPFSTFYRRSEWLMKVLECQKEPSCGISSFSLLHQLHQWLMLDRPSATRRTNCRKELSIHAGMSWISFFGYICTFEFIFQAIDYFSGCIQLPNVTSVWYAETVLEKTLHCGSE